MTERSFLANQFLIAMPSLQDPNFSRTVTYICEHNADGAMGIVINRPIGFKLDEVLEHMGISCHSPSIKAGSVYAGGPVQQERGFVLHTPVGAWDSSLAVGAEIAVTTSKDILQSIAAEGEPREHLVALGYAGWGEGQLEREMAENAWLAGPMTPDLMFHTPDEQRWEAAAALLGVDIKLMSAQVGHG